MYPLYEIVHFTKSLTKRKLVSDVIMKGNCMKNQTEVEISLTIGKRWRRRFEIVYNNLSWHRIVLATHFINIFHFYRITNTHTHTHAFIFDKCFFLLLIRLTEHVHKLNCDHHKNTLYHHTIQYIGRKIQIHFLIKNNNSHDYNRYFTVKCFPVPTILVKKTLH